MSFVLGLVLAIGALSVPAQICAHRGDVSAAPENTLPAFRSAVEKGAQQIEFDVDLTKDGELVIMHDATVDRTTNGKGKVTELTFDEIRALDAGAKFSATFKDTRVPTLRDALEVIPPKILCNVHLKGNTELARKAALLIQEMGRLEQCFLACELESVAAAREVVPTIKTCNMSRQAGNRAAYIDATIANKCEYIQLHERDGHENIEADVKKLHDHGVTVNWFGADDAALIEKLNRAGVDYVLTDKLDLALATIQKIRADR
ncbi:MAG: glycerophosphodiester phosphodiesterase [Candidatus Hydrogenedentes bacterium]|nr:glycerophosphodiester phosphodiesterase [Candidatus Hydrogenedentota bacterium]